MAATKPITAFVLLYGDYPELAERCLGSIATNAYPLCPGNLRIGMNACGARTHQYVRKLIADNLVLEENIYACPENIKKYPLMRQMFYDEANPITTDYVMWFDDDSFIRDIAFLDAVYAALDENKDGRSPDMLGSVYKINVNANQRRWIMDQPWFADRPISASMRFITGGWWTIRTDVLRTFDYPFPELVHRGGDVMMGALAEQQNLWLKMFRENVAINADDAGRESRSPKRGFDEKPIGFNYLPSQKPHTMSPSPPAVAKILKEVSKKTGPPLSQPRRSIPDLDL